MNEAGEAREDIKTGRERLFGTSPLEEEKKIDMKVGGVHFYLQSAEMS